MTAEQAKQYEICKSRRHEEGPQGDATSYGQNLQNQLSQQAMNRGNNPWKICRWCGTEYQEVQEWRQVERAV